MSTYSPIQAITLTSTASTVEFTGIPQTFTDLVIVIDGNTSSAINPNIRFNADSASNYSVTWMAGNGTTTTSSRQSSQAQALFGAFTTLKSNAIIQVMKYSQTTTNKTFLARNSSTDGATTNQAISTWIGLWRKTEAITSLSLNVGANPWASGSTFTLYGIASGAPKAFGGDEVRTDGTYWYHIFNSSGRFETLETLNNVDFLVVAGGGGGGGQTGGGAGGFRTSAGTSGANSAAESKLSLTAGFYAVTVGAGGPAYVGSNQGSDGGNSTFATITSVGGGGGGNRQENNSLTNGRSGGSGGGGVINNANTFAGSGGSGTANQGLNGGAGRINFGEGGGGGGASQAGGQNNSTVGGKGGDGIASSITGSSVTYAGGGGGSGNGGSTGGTGGGGAQDVAGTANRGGGGGARANGGSGIVIVRYAV